MQRRLVGDPGEGKSKLKYYMTVGVIFFTLLTFVAPAAVESMFSGSDGAIDEYVSFTVPGGERITISYSDFIQMRKRLNDVVDLNPMLGTLEMAYGQKRDLDERDAASIIAYAAAAEAEGVALPEVDYQTAMQQMLGQLTSEQYVTLLRRKNILPSDFQASVRKIMLARRYQSLLSQVTSLADPAAIELQFQEQHKEYAFDYVELEVGSFSSSANELELDDVVLEEWLEALPAAQKRAFYAPDRWSAELAGWAVGDEVPQELLAAYPLEEGVEIDELVMRYYEEVKGTRFPLEEPVEIDGAMTWTQSLQEVREAAEIEMPIYFAMQSWHADLLSRQAALAQQALDQAVEDEAQDAESSAEAEEANTAEAAGDEDESDVATVPAAPLEPIELVSEASGLGLRALPSDTLRTREEWTDLEGLGCDQLGLRMGSMPTGTIYAFMTVSESGFSVSRRVEREESYLPEFAELRDQLELAWREEQQGELALAELTGIVDRLRELAGSEEEADEADETDETDATGETGETDATPVEDPAFEALAGIEEGAFAQAAAEAQHEVLRLDWFDPRRPAPRSDSEEPDPRLLAENDLRSRGGMRLLGAGGIQEPFLDADRSHAYLVRLENEREGDLSTMTAADYNGLKASNRSTQQSSFSQETLLSYSELDDADVFNLYLYLEDPEVIRAREEAQAERDAE